MMSRFELGTYTDLQDNLRVRLMDPGGCSLCCNGIYHISRNDSGTVSDSLASV